MAVRPLGEDPRDRGPQTARAVCGPDRVLRADPDPGGKPAGEAGDAAARAAARLVELWEETGIRAGSPVPPAQLRALGVLAAEQPLTCGRLGARLHLTPSAAGRLCARMEDAGLLWRRRAAGDRRRTELVLTPGGRRTLLAVRAHRREVLRELLGESPGAPGNEESAPGGAVA
ncbi:MarR family transcriptional regulator, partial [Streptomyces alkaliphilus]